jgi:GNAT superfamily N-acetyltransferase
MEERQVRRARPDEVAWIVELSARVQDALTASGSLQQIGPLPVEMVQTLVSAGQAYVLERDGRPVGSVLVDPLPAASPLHAQWQLHSLPGPLWFLHALMLEPAVQGQRLGLDFLEGVRRLTAPAGGTIFLDCWAGNDKLRDFYRRADFTFHGIYPFEDYEVAVFLYPGDQHPTRS